jgi:hypothetical protein
MSKLEAMQKMSREEIEFSTRMDNIEYILSEGCERGLSFPQIVAELRKKGVTEIQLAQFTVYRMGVLLVEAIDRSKDAQGFRMPTFDVPGPREEPETVEPEAVETLIPVRCVPRLYPVKVSSDGAATGGAE